MKYTAFLSYARVDNQPNEPINKFRNALLLEVRQQGGIKDFNIFLDTEGVKSGENWKEILLSNINTTHFLIAILSPSYFNSDNCNLEFDEFLKREKELSRNDLIIPIFWRDYEKKDTFRIQTIEQRQREDFRLLREADILDSNYRKEIAKIANRIVEIINVYESSKQKFEELNIPDSSDEKDFIQSEGVLYSERMLHFRDEKKYLCDKFSDFLLARIRILSRTTDNIFLFIDSGTTLFHLFSRIGKFAVANSYSTPNHWINKIVIITNNMTGIRLLSKIAVQENNSKRFVEPVLKCISISGVPYPTYSAFLGFDFFVETELRKSFEVFQPDYVLKNFIDEIRTKKINCKIISVVTGSWVRIRETSPRIPLPLARGTGHIQYKQTIVDIADEVYIVATLGKIFAGQSKEQVYSVLDHFASDATNPTHYNELNVTTENFSAGNLKLVTTSRPREGYILSNLSEKLEKVDYLDVQRVTLENLYTVRRSFCDLPFSSIPNIMFDYFDVSDNVQKQFEEEFPHKASREQLEFLKSFHIDQKFIEEFLKNNNSAKSK